MNALQKRAMFLVLLFSYMLLAAGLFSRICFSEEKWGNRQKEMCANNLRLIGQAIALYCDDHDGYFPIPGKWPVLLYPKYLKESSAFSCPAADTDTPPTSWIGLENRTRYSGHYGMNNELNDPNAVKQGWISMPNLKIMKNKEIIPAVMDIKGPHVVFTPSGVSNDDGEQPISMAPRHDNGCNMLWADGHVSWLSWERYVELGSQGNGWGWLTNWK